MGTVATKDAHVSGALAVTGDHATLLNNTSITASDHSAAISLARGGEVLVCSTSQLHLLHSTGNALLFGLDRGALEIASASQPGDVILTPDIRFTVEHPGTFDLSLRVTRNGDTCVDNHGPTSPVLLLNASFTGATYRLMPGQHVLFEHGDLRQVVDNERTSCGCPQAPVSPSQLPPKATPAQRAAAEHPFPEAQSQGLTNEAPLPEPTGTSDASADTQFRINGGDTSAVALTTTPAGSPLNPTQPQPKHKRGFFGAIGHFFHRIFHPNS